MRLIFSRLHRRLSIATENLRLMIRLVNFVLFLTVGCIVSAIATMAIEVQLAKLSNQAEEALANKDRTLFYYDLLVESERDSRIANTFQLFDNIDNPEDIPAPIQKFIDLLGLDYVLSEFDHSLVWARVYIDSLVEKTSLNHILTPSIRSDAKELSTKFGNEDYQDDDIEEKYMYLLYEIYQEFSNEYDKSQDIILEKRKLASNIFLYSFLIQIAIYIFYYIGENFIIGRRVDEE
jgi:hypothetical protein